MILQDLRRPKLFFVPSQLFELTYYFGEAIMVGKPQWPAAERRKTGAENHTVIRIFSRFDHLLFQTAGRLVNHQKNKPPTDRVAFNLHLWIALRVRWNGRTLWSFGIAVKRCPPFFQRFVRRLRSAFKPVKASTGFPAQHLGFTQPKQNGGGMIPGAICLL